MLEATFFAVRELRWVIAISFGMANFTQAASISLPHNTYMRSYRQPVLIFSIDDTAAEAAEGRRRTSIACVVGTWLC